MDTTTLLLWQQCAHTCNTHIPQVSLHTIHTLCAHIIILCVPIYTVCPYTLCAHIYCVPIYTVCPYIHFVCPYILCVPIYTLCAHIYSVFPYILCVPIYTLCGCTTIHEYIPLYTYLEPWPVAAAYSCMLKRKGGTILFMWLMSQMLSCRPSSLPVFLITPRSPFRPASLTLCDSM